MARAKAGRSRSSERDSARLLGAKCNTMTSAVSVQPAFRLLEFPIAAEFATRGGFFDGVRVLGPLLLRISVGAGDSVEGAETRPRATGCSKGSRMLAVALSSDARAVIRSGRTAHRPTTADRRRVDAALRARLGPTVLPVETPLRDLLLNIGWQLPSGAALGLCLIGGALFFALRPVAMGGFGSQARERSASALSSSASLVASSERPASIAPEPAPVVVRNESSSKPMATSAAPASPSSDSLAQEVALLSRAMTQLHSGQATQAVMTLDEHQRRFPNGALSQERCAMRARTLCKLRRFSEGRAELAGLGAGSLAYQRVVTFCDSVVATGRR